MNNKKSSKTLNTRITRASLGGGIFILTRHNFIMKKLVLILITVFAVLLLFGCTETTSTFSDNNFVEEKYFRNAFSEENFSISFSESLEKIKGDIPKSVKVYVNLSPKEGETFSYSYSLEDQTSNTGGCPGNCIVVKDEEKGVLSDTYFEKEYFLTNFVKNFEQGFFAIQFKVISPSGTNYLAEQFYSCIDNNCTATQPRIFREFPEDFDFNTACMSETSEYYKNGCLSNLASEAVKLEVCDLITDIEEKNHCYRSIGSLTRDVNICEKTENVTNPYRDYCFKEVATAKYNEKICEKIVKQTIKDSCYSEIGPKKGIEEICQRIVEDKEARSDCYKGVAEENFDFELCDKVENKEKRGRCYGYLESRNIADWVSKDNPIWNEFTPISIETLNKKGLTGKYSVQGYVIDSYECPPCPEGALCGICMQNNVTFASENNKNSSNEKKFTLIVTHPKWFKQDKLYTLYLTVREVDGRQYIFLKGENS